MEHAGIGVDILEISRMERVLERTPSFAQRMFTDEERAYCEHAARPAVHYAARFAAREAVLKALGCGFSQGVGRKDVSVSSDQYGKPVAVLTGRAKEIADALGVVEIALSLSHTADLAVANALAITAEARPQKDEPKQDERAQLAKSFKDARSVLDELDRAQEAGMMALDMAQRKVDERVGSEHETSSEL